MANYKELIVWQKSIVLTKEIYTLTKKFPASETYSLTSQIQRASTSISANIAEGSGRGSSADFSRFLIIARGSLYELESHLNIAQAVEYINDEQLKKFEVMIEEVAKMLNKLISSLKNAA